MNKISILQAIKEKEKINGALYIACTTQAEANILLGFVEKLGYIWGCSRNLPTQITYWKEYKEKTYYRLDCNNKQLSYGYTKGDAMVNGHKLYQFEDIDIECDSTMPYKFRQTIK